jgi:hypothetical protein
MSPVTEPEILISRAGKGSLAGEPEVNTPLGSLRSRVEIRLRAAKRCTAPSNDGDHRPAAAHDSRMVKKLERTEIARQV